MKRKITNYTFNASAKTVVFNGYTSITLDQILLITNLNTNTIIYNFAQNGQGGSVRGNVLTLAFNTLSMNNTDPLQIWFDDGVYNSYDSSNNLLVTDNNLLTTVTKLLDKENPFNTQFGQQVCSISEDFWARLNRLGRPRSNEASGVPVSSTAGVLTITAGITTSIGCLLYPTICSVSCSADAILVIQAPSAGIQDQQIMYAAYTYAKAGTPITVRFNGEGYCSQNVGIGVGAIPMVNNSGGLIYGSCNGIEIEVNY